MADQPGSPFLDAAFCEQVVPIDDIPERTGAVTGDQVPVAEGAREGGDADTLDGRHAADFALLTHSHIISRPFGMVGEVDDRDSLTFYFETEGTNPVVRISLKGLRYPRRHTVDLPLHDHGAGASSTHTHDLTTGNQSANHIHTNGAMAAADHRHSGVTVGLGTSGYVGNTLPVSGAMDGVDADHHHSGTSGAPSATATTPAGLNGGTLAATLKEYADTLTVKIDGTDVTSKILADASWAKIGDGTSTHPFHVGGTTILDASLYVTYASGLHSLEIIEPITDRGCRVSAYIQTEYSADPKKIILGTDAETVDGFHASDLAPASRTIGTTSPLSGGGSLAADRVISLGVVPVTLGGSGASSQPAARAYRSANDAIATGGWARVNFDTEVYDTGADYDNATNFRFVCDVAGYYLLVGSVYLGGGGAGCTADMVVRVNNAATSQARACLPSGKDTVLKSSDIRHLAVGDFVDVYVYQDSGGNMTCIGTQELTFLAVSFLHA